MTTALPITALTLAEVAKRKDPDGTTPIVAELLSKHNQILEDMLFMEGNLPTGHRVTVRTGLPDVYFRSINQGIPASRSQTATVDEGTCLLEAQSSVDVELMRLAGNNRTGVRYIEDVAFVEAMSQKMAETLIYGNAGTDPKSFTGFAVRYGDLSAGNAANIIDAGGTGSDNTSIYMAVWGEGTVFSIYPQNTSGGLETHDHGEDWVEDSNGRRYRAETTQYVWRNGLAVKDWRYAARACNIDVSNLVANSSAADLIDLLDSLSMLPNSLDAGRPVFYVNRTVYAALRKQARAGTTSVLDIVKGFNQFGTPSRWMEFNGIPIRRVDAILNTEARVV